MNLEISQFVWEIPIQMTVDIMKQNDAKITIIGAGVVGLAIAYQLSQKHENIFVVEKNMQFGEETSARSSEVIHSGIYYPSNSLKTKLCIQGREMLYDFCDEFNVNYNKCGKLIIAITEEEISQLDKIKNQAIKNGLNCVKELSIEELTKLEPNINALGALLVSDTGVVESYGFMKELENLAVNNGVQFVYGSSVQKLNKERNGYKIILAENDGSIFDFSSEILINASGLNSDVVSNMLGIENVDYELHYCKGEYFAVGNGKNKLVNRLIYPVPNPNLVGLGVHVTIDVDKGLKLGPNAIYQNDREIDYTVDENHRSDFFKSAKRFLPFLEEEDLYPAYAGMRPKLQKQGDSFRDFVIQEEKDRGYENYYNLIGIESPGLTASLAIGKYVNELISK